jgi:hypothetical protein
MLENDLLSSDKVREITISELINVILLFSLANMAKGLGGYGV